MSFLRASGCKYSEGASCRYNKVSDPHNAHDTDLPGSRVVGGCMVCQGEGVEIIISVKLFPRSIIVCLITLGAVTVLTLLAIKCIELNLNGSVIG